MSLDKNDTSLGYKYSKKASVRKFKIVKRDNKYLYFLKEKLNPFGSQMVYFTKNGNIFDKRLFRPQLTCKYELAKNEHPIKSLYHKDNYLRLIPSTKRLLKLSIEQKESNTTTNKDIDVPLKLLPIYGNAKDFGILNYILEPNKLTLDKEFSLKVADIFMNQVKKMKKDKKLLSKIYANKEIIEGATVVLKIDKDGNKKIVALFSYPYPKDLDAIEKEIIIDRLNPKYSTIKNRAFNLLTAPGSTFKIVTSIALAKENKLKSIPYIKGVSDLKDVYFQGKKEWKLGFPLRNSSGEITYYSDYQRAFAESYNTYFGYAGLLLHKRLQNNYTKNLMPILLNKEDRKKEFSLIEIAENLYFNREIWLSKEYNIKATASRFPSVFLRTKDIADASIGQYEVRATPLQMAIVTSTIYDGYLQVPTIVKGENNSKYRVLNNKQLQPIQDAMRKVVTFGTGKNGFRSFTKKYKNKIKVYGKTGTSQTAKKGLYDGWFVSFTKGLQEDIVVVTLVRNSGYGSKYALPVNRAIIEAWIERLKEK